MPEVESDGEIALLCHRCGAELTPGEGNFYVVRIVAVADPAPPKISDEDLDRDLDVEIEEILREVAQMGPQELSDQVFRRLTVHLCTPCYRQWIENPTG